MYVPLMFSKGSVIFVYYIPKKEKELRLKLLGRNVKVISSDKDNCIVELNNKNFTLKKSWLCEQPEIETNSY